MILCPECFSVELKDCSLPEYYFIQGLLFIDVIVQASYILSVADENLITFLLFFLIFCRVGGGGFLHLSKPNLFYTHLICKHPKSLGNAIQKYSCSKFCGKLCKSLFLRKSNHNEHMSWVSCFSVVGLWWIKLRGKHRGLQTF